jgi:hypothetical protein
MRPRSLLLPATFVLFAGCYGWEPLPAPDAIVQAEIGVRVELVDGMRITLERFEVRADTVYATAGQCRPAGAVLGTAVRSWCSGLAIALKDVRTAETRIVHRRRSAILVLLGGLVGTAFMIALLEMWTGRV